MKEFRCKMMIAVLIICMLAMVGCGNTADTPTSSESSTVESENVESTVESTEEVEESTVESTEETTAESTEESATEESSTEELSVIEERVATLIEELQITDEEKVAVVTETMESLYEEKGIWWVDKWTERMKLDWDWLKDKAKDDISLHFDTIAVGILHNQSYEKAAEYAVERANNAEGIKWDSNNLPADRAWIDDLAEKLAAKDLDAVHEILCDDSIVEKAAPYRDPSVDGDSKGEAYRLMTTDGRYVGLRLNEGSADFTRAAFYSEVEEDRDFGFKYLGMGDVWVQCKMNKETGELTRMWFDGDIYHKPDGTEMKWEKEVLTKWFYLVDIENLM